MKEEMKLRSHEANFASFDRKSQRFLIALLIILSHEVEDEDVVYETYE
jgi:hypothetical protein